MAERTAPKKRASRQAMVEMVADAEKTVSQRKKAEAKPEEQIAAKVVSDAVAVADAISSEGVIRSIGELKSTIARTLTQLSDRLEEEIGKYGQICRAIAAKETELKEIYEIPRSASTLLAILETQQQKQEEFEHEYQTKKEELDHEIETTRAEWEQERDQWEQDKRQREQEVKERDALEQKRRQRELEEYKYNFAREQQLARDQAQDELAKVQKELAERKTQLEREWAEREKAIAAREEELAELRALADGFKEELEAATNRAVADAKQRLEQQHQSAQELLRREFDGEKNVLITKVASLERLVQEQAEQIARFAQQAEKSYTQVQEIAMRAIEGSASSKQFSQLQQLLAEQVRKSSSPDRG